MPAVGDSDYVEAAAGSCPDAGLAALHKVHQGLAHGAVARDEDIDSGHGPVFKELAVQCGHGLVLHQPLDVDEEHSAFAVDFAQWADSGFGQG